MKGIPNNRAQLRELYPHPRHLLYPGNYKRARKNGPELRAVGCSLGGEVWECLEADEEWDPERSRRHAEASKQHVNMSEASMTASH